MSALGNHTILEASLKQSGIQTTLRRLDIHNVYFHTNHKTILILLKRNELETFNISDAIGKRTLIFSVGVHFTHPM